jgi:YfiH family protein
MFYSKKIKKFQNIKHCFYTKKNGFSDGIYQSLNCSLGSNDKKANVIKNLEFVSKNIGVKNNNLILMNQTHSNKVIVVDGLNKSLSRFNSDALITDLKDVAISVLTADCVPIILYDEVNKIIGCIHAGWKGAISGIIENTIQEFSKLNKKIKITAAVGPCIGSKSYEVDSDFYNNFLNISKENQIFFEKTTNNKFLFDIRKYVNKRLIDCEVLNIDNIELDSCKDDKNFFSYRRSQKLNEIDYGRCISTICLKN